MFVNCFSVESKSLLFGRTSSLMMNRTKLCIYKLIELNKFTLRQSGTKFEQKLNDLLEIKIKLKLK